jgi:hypothetical protein
MSIWNDYVFSAQRAELHRERLCLLRAQRVRYRQGEEAAEKGYEDFSHECRRLGKIIVKIVSQED